MTAPTKVRINGTAVVHLAAMLDDRVIGRRCNTWPGGGKRIRVEITADAVTCKACKRIDPAASAA